ncbi:hypothetical protein CAPTEDRAFT_199997 [Capitella teleta]|uniref:THAP-type domain-containing protein n=1 Tax=Capitella teleta TaxID=283909 RepID=R7TUH0_CAPTE|nr:hypothetical protein CAPTEDRAFT_199997 [Capitella teleta]|eukprot:ELT94675.1 hypothetical protein CAPTEDRAFT_199997 [Capitella teleta]
MAEKNAVDTNARKSKWKTGYGIQCAAPGCDSYQGTCDLPFRAFPKTEERCRLWVQFMRRQDFLGKSVKELSKKKLCNLHFEDSQFMNSKDRRSKLMPSAIPTLFNVPNPPKLIETKRKAPADRRPPAKKLCLESSPPLPSPPHPPSPPSEKTHFQSKIQSLQKANDMLRKRAERAQKKKKSPSKRCQRETAINLVSKFLTGPICSEIISSHCEK